MPDDFTWEDPPGQEILPMFDSILAKASTCSPDGIRNALADIALGRFSATEEDRLLAALQAATGVKSRALQADLKQAKKATPKTPLAATTPALSGAWRGQLIRYESDNPHEEGPPKPIVANVFTVMTTHPLCNGMLALDEFTTYITLIAAPPWSSESERNAFKRRPWSDDDSIDAAIWLQLNTGVEAPTHIVFEGIKAAANRQRIHPPRDYLESLVWDHVPRIDGLFIDYYSCTKLIADEYRNVFFEDIPEDERARLIRLVDYYEAVGSRFMIGAVARIYQPGCKHDCMPNIVGAQGALKSSSFRVLFTDEWFTDEISELGTKDAAMQAAGIWCIEFGELAALRATTRERVKAWLSRQFDRFRPPYGHGIKTQPRQCVAVGTTNEDEFLTDVTGNRRSWALPCGKILIDKLKRDRDQLWAEAVARYKNGERWWLHESALIETAAEVQAEYLEQDVWHGLVAEYLGGLTKPEVTVGEVLSHIGVLQQDRNQKHQNRVVGILKTLNWKQGWKKVGHVSVKCYRPKPAEDKGNANLDTVAGTVAGSNQ